MTSFTTHQAKTQLSKLLRQVEAGEEVVITRGTIPVARLVPMETSRPRSFGKYQGLLQVPEDFDAPLPDDVVTAFEGE